MNVNITGIGPMMACLKGAQSLTDFTLDHLWSANGHEWFDPKVDLGGRGFKYFNSATRYLIAAIKQFETAPDKTTVLPDAPRRGVVVGSNSCTRQELDEIDHTLLEKGSGAIHPMRATSFCANMGAGTISIKYQAKAFNITLMNPMTAGLEAVILAKNAILDGRASNVIAGAMEDDSEFSLGSDYPVKTSGGAWALRLELEEKPDPAGGERNGAIARIGATFNCFIPIEPDNEAEDSKSLTESLEQDFAPLLTGGDNLRVHVSMLTDSHSRSVFGLLKRIMNKYGVGETAITIPSKDTEHGTLLSLAQLSWCCLNADRAVCVAISPLGHISAVEVLKPDSKGS